MSTALFCMIECSTESPSDLIWRMYSSSFSTFFRYRVVCSFSVGSTSFGQPPSACLILDAFVTSRSVFVSCSE